MNMQLDTLSLPLLQIVQHIVGQLEVLTRTVSLFEERLSHTENKVSHIPLSYSSYCIEEKNRHLA